MANLQKVVFAIVTFYQKEMLRFRLACKTVASAVAAGHQVVIVDGSNDPSIQAEFEKLGALVFREKVVKGLHAGLGTAKRQSFFHAVEVAKQGGYAGVLADEAEKDLAEFVPEILGSFFKTQPSHVVVPSRSTKSWDSYPKFQADSEQAGNRVFNLVTKNLENTDVFFGPVFFTIDAAHDFLAQDAQKLGFVDTYAQHLGVMLALADHNTGVHSVKIDFIYPPEQRVEEEGAMNLAMLEKRAKQLSTLTESYRNAGRILFGDKRYPYSFP